MYRLCRQLTLVACVVSVVACRKDRREATLDDLLMMVDHAYAEKCLLPLLPIVNNLEVGPGHWVPPATGPFCLVLDSITGDTATLPPGEVISLHLRFDPSGCGSLDGVVREGRIVARYDTVRNGLAVLAGLWTPDLRVMDLRIRAGASCTHTDPNLWRLRVDSSAIWYDGDWSRRFQGDVNYLRVISDPQAPASYQITVNVVGGDRKGRIYGSTTSVSLDYRLNCAWITSGTEVITYDDGYDRMIDHGPGTCDASVWLHVGTERFGLTIP